MTPLGMSNKSLGGSLTKPGIGRYVGVTGVSAVEVPSGTQTKIRVLRARQQSDIVELN